MLSQIVYSEGLMPTQSADLHSALKKRLISIFSTANFQDLQYLKDCQFEFEVRNLLNANVLVDCAKEANYDVAI